MPGNVVSILLVEDNSVDAEAVERAFREAKIANPIYVAHDGVEGLALIRGQGVQPIPRPYLILLDLNMPRMNGFEFLAQLREDEQLKASIVFVLTSSDDDRDKAAAYDQQIAGYMVKSRAGEDFVDLIQMLDHYWRIVEFPPETS